MQIASLFPHIPVRSLTIDLPKPYLLVFEQNTIFFVFNYALFLHFRKLVAHRAAVNIQVICQLLTVIWNQKRIASDMFGTF